MAEVHCKRCGSTGFAKSGFVRGHQRNRCRLRLQLHRHAEARQARGDESHYRGGGTVLLDAMGSASYGMIARLFSVGEVAVFKWIRKEAAALPEPVTPAEGEIVQRHEMGHFVDGKEVLALESLRSGQPANPKSDLRGLASG